MKNLVNKIKDTLSIFSSSKGFTLLELLVVVLIIGILAAIALPQYKMAVTKAKVASILPLMRRWKEAYAEYKLQYGYYCSDDGCPNAETLGVNWPSDWNCNNSRTICSNDYFECNATDDDKGYILCEHGTSDGGVFYIYMYQPDEPDEILRDKIVCQAGGTEATKICKAFGGKLIDGEDGSYGAVYSFN